MLIHTSKKKLVLEYQCKVTNTGAHIISHCFISANITVKEDSYFFFHSQYKETIDFVQKIVLAADKLTLVYEE